MRANAFTFEMACNAIWAVEVMGWSQTKAAVVLKCNVGTICHVCHRRRFPEAYPVPIAGYV